METEKKYMKIGKAVIDECIARGDEGHTIVTLRIDQFEGKLYIRMEDAVDPISIWMFSDLKAVSMVNRAQKARERAEALAVKIRRAELHQTRHEW